jgi:thioredoxin
MGREGIMDVNVERFDEQVLAASGPVLVEFYATWCANCRRLAPVLDRLADEFAGRVTFVKVNVDENQALVDRYEVSATPTLVMFNAGSQVGRVVGAQAEPAVRALVSTALDRSPAASRPWVAPDACTLPTAEQPLRVAEFDDLFTTSVTWVDRPETTRLLLGLPSDPAVAARAADLAMRESGCCSFFTFALTVSGARLQLEVTVPEARTDVLDGLAARAAAGARS